MSMDISSEMIHRLRPLMSVGNSGVQRVWQRADMYYYQLIVILLFLSLSCFQADRTLMINAFVEAFCAERHGFLDTR